MHPPPVSQISPDEERKIVIKGMNDRAIALIARNIKATIDTVKAMEQQASVNKDAQAAI